MGFEAMLAEKSTAVVDDIAKKLGSNEADETNVSTIFISSATKFQYRMRGKQALGTKLLPLSLSVP